MEPQTNLDLGELRDHLWAAGWDALASEIAGEVAARLQHPPSAGVWTLTVDRSGRLRFTATREARAPAGGRLERSGREFRWLRESSETCTITCKVQTAAELPDILIDLQALALDQCEGHLSQTWGEESWNSNTETPYTTTDL